MARDEVSNLVTDIARAIQSSDLLTLLLRPTPESQKRSLLRRLNHHQQSSMSVVKCLAEIPKSILDDRVKPIRTALEKIDAQTLLALEIVPDGTAGGGARVRDGVYCRPICDQIRPPMNIDDDVAMDGGDVTSKSSLVRYLHIAEAPDEYTIGIFVFGPGERIPLHDHPEMCVLSRVLYGDLQRLSLDLDRRDRSPNDDNFCLSRSNSSINSSMDTDEDEDDYEDDGEEDNMNEASNSSISKFLSSSAPPGTNSNNNSSSSSPIFNLLSRSANWLHHNLYNNSIDSEGFQLDDDVDALHSARHKHRNQQQHQQQQTRTTLHYPEGTKLAYRNAVDVLEAPNVASLYPYEGNLHEFVAGPHGAAVLDVLLPPYDDERKRDCTFYHIRDIEGTTTTPANADRRSVPAHEALDFSMSLPLSPPRSGGPTKPKPTDETQQQQQQQRQPCYIVPTGQPENFHCISGRYKDLGDNDDYSESECDEE